MRKCILITLVLAGVILASNVAISDSAIPKLVNYGKILDRNGIPNYPIKDCIFPSVLKVSEYLSNPLGKYYMYFAPHDPSGIWLAYADSLTGPWTVLKEIFSPASFGIDFDHLSSPDAIWISEECKIFVFFHGPNQNTRYAVSTDGINFSCGDKIAWGDYARVYKYTIPRYNNKYILLTSTVNGHGTRDVHLCYSNDARNWSEQSAPLFSETALAGQNITYVCSPLFVPYNGRYYVWVHGDSLTPIGNNFTSVFSVEVGANLDMQNYAGKVYDREQVYSGNERAGDPYVYTEPGDDKSYMFISAGPRLGQDIYLATSSRPIVFGSDSTPPTIVRLNTPLVNQQTITLSWDPATDAESDIDNYLIYRGSAVNPAALYKTVNNVLVFTDRTGMENTTFHYRVKAINRYGLTSPDFSNDVSITTAADTVKPVVIAISVLANTVQITFSEKVEKTSAENADNYTIRNGVSITAASLQADQKTIALSVSALTLWTNYFLNASGIKDQASIPNTMNALDTTFSPQIYPLYNWPLDETDVLAASDATGHGNSAALHGSPVWGTGKFGNALTFDGVDDYLSTSVQQMNPNVFTLSLWFKTTSTTGGKLIGFGNAQTATSEHYDRHLYMSNDGKVYFGCYNGSVQTINTTLAFNDNAWHYVAATLSSAGMALYIDSALIAVNTNATNGENNTGYWRMGFDDVTGWPGAPSSNYFSGQLDDIRVYDRALSASEIASLYDGGTENEPVIFAPENLLLEASPNPFNPSAYISYCLPQKAVVTLALYNPQGKKVRELVCGMVSAGRHTLQVEAGGLASGIYFCELKGGATVKKLKLVLMR